jgi:hypothetical protein
VTNSGNVIYDPQGNATRTTAQGPAPNQWSDGSIVGVLVDRINDTVQFTLNGAPQGGPFDIAGLGNKTVYPFTDSWSGPVRWPQSTAAPRALLTCRRPTGQQR